MASDTGLSTFWSFRAIAPVSRSIVSGIVTSTHSVTSSSNLACRVSWAGMSSPWNLSIIFIKFVSSSVVASSRIVSKCVLSIFEASSLACTSSLSLASQFAPRCLIASKWRCNSSFLMRVEASNEVISSFKPSICCWIGAARFVALASAMGAFLALTGEYTTRPVSSFSSR